MKKIIGGNKGAKLLAVIIFFAMAGCPMRGLTGSGEKTVSGLTIILSSEKDVCLPGEPVMLTLSLENRTSSPIPIHMALMARYGWISFQVAEEGGAYKHYLGPFGATEAIFRPAPLEPGKRISESYKILYNGGSSGWQDDMVPGNYAFGGPGTYSVRIRLSDIVPGETIFTEPVRIRITEPEGTDAVVWDLLQTRDAAYFLHTSYDDDTNIAEDFGQIIARYPDSSYVPYLQRSLDEFEPSRLRHARKSSRPAKAEIIDISGQPLMVRTFPDTRKRSGTSYTNKDVEEIAELTELRTKAYNANDPPGLIRYMSYRNGRDSLPRRWERYSDMGRRDLAESFREAFAKKGTASVRLVRVTFKEDGMAEADLVISYEKAPHENPFQKTTYILDDDGVWRIGTLELEW